MLLKMTLSLPQDRVTGRFKHVGQTFFYQEESGWGC